MSMILDALSKAEQERRNGIGADLDPARYVSQQTVKEDGIRRWILIALAVNILLLSAFIVFYFWKNNPDHEQPVNAAMDAKISSVVEPSKPAAIVKPENANHRNGSKTSPALTSGQPKQISQSTSTSLQQEAVVKHDSSFKISKQEAIGAVSDKKPKVTYTNTPLANESSAVQIPALPKTQQFSKSYLSISDLSASQRAQLSQYEINVHVYDTEATQRFVLVNMTKFKEGDRLPGGGPTIAEITPEGLVMEFNQGKVLIERN